MRSDRYVVLGLAPARAEWFVAVARWATGGALPIEFVKTVSVEELRARLASGRRFSLVLIGDDVLGVDRDVIDSAREASCPAAVVATRDRRDWTALGASAVLRAGFDRAELLDVLERCATPVVRADHLPVDGTPEPTAAWRAHLVAVTGAGGTGRSTVAMALAQGLARDPRFADLTCLADLSLRAELAMLHDAPDVVPSVVELVDAHRTEAPAADGVRDLTWTVTERGYQLLLGLRRQREWTSIRPRAFDAALDGLRRAFRVVVADVDADVEGEETTGSMDVEDRNLMARATLVAADVVLVVGRPGLKGIHSLVRVVADLAALGVSSKTMVPVLNGAPRGLRARAELTSAMGVLTAASAPGLPSPLFVPSRRHLDDLLRAGDRLPESLVAPVSAPVRALLETATAPSVALRSTPVAVRPGTLGAWSEEEPA